MHFGQRRNWYPQGQFFIQHVVFSHVTVRQHIVAQRLAVAQAGAVAQHNPRIGTQHGDVIGHGFGVAGADANIDQTDAAAVCPYQMVGRHLRQPNRRLTLGVLNGFLQHSLITVCEVSASGQHVAGLNQANVLAVGVAHELLAKRDKLVNVKLVVGQQCKVLKPMRRGACVMAQAVQRVVHPRRCKKRQWFGVSRLEIHVAVGDGIVHHQ